MGDALAQAAAQTELTAEQRDRFLDLVRADPYIGHIAAARKAGVPGTKGQLRKLVAGDTDLQAGIAEARADAFAELGLGTAALLKKLASVVDANDNPSQLRAIQYAFALQGVNPADRVEHTGPDGGPVEVTNPDVAAAIDRFTISIRTLAERAQSSGAIRASHPGAAALPAGDAGA